MSCPTFERLLCSNLREWDDRTVVTVRKTALPIDLGGLSLHERDRGDATEMPDSLDTETALAISDNVLRVTGEAYIVRDFEAFAQWFYLPPIQIGPRHPLNEASRVLFHHPPRHAILVVAVDRKGRSFPACVDRLPASCVPAQLRL